MEDVVRAVDTILSSSSTATPGHSIHTTLCTRPTLIVRVCTSFSSPNLADPASLVPTQHLLRRMEHSVMHKQEQPNPSDNAETSRLCCRIVTRRYRARIDKEIESGFFHLGCERNLSLRTARCGILVAKTPGSAGLYPFRRSSLRVVQLVVNRLSICSPLPL